MNIEVLSWRRSNMHNDTRVKTMQLNAKRTATRLSRY